MDMQIDFHKDGQIAIKWNDSFKELQAESYTTRWIDKWKTDE